MRAYGDKVYASFRGLNVPKDGLECESFTAISIDSLQTCKNSLVRQLCL